MPAAAEADIAAAREVGAILRRDPTAFTKGVLGVRPWSAQRRILESVRDHRRTLVVSAHGIGKTCIGSCVLLEWMATRSDAGAVVSASTYDQAHDLLWAEARKLYDGAAARGLPLGGDYQERQWVMPDGSQAVIQNPKNAVSAHGRHPANMLVLLDEAEGVPASHIDAYDSLMSGGYARMLAFLNPLLSSGWCFEASKRPDLWNVIYVSAREHPNVVTGRNVVPKAVTKAWCDEKLEQWGESDPRYQARVLGRFPDASTDQLISVAWLEAAADATTGVDVEPAMGCDVARSLEGDFNVAHVLDKHRRTVHVEKFRSKDLVVTAGRFRAVAEKFGVPAHRIGVDVCGGYGGSVLDTWRNAGFRATPIDFGSDPKGDWRELVGKDIKFKNRRAELHWVGREALRKQVASIPRTFGGTWSDIATPIFWFDPAGRICIEPKDDIKERIGRSPDEGDAFFLALGVPHGEPRLFSFL